jgi:hypothetical protein
MSSKTIIYRLFVLFIITALANGCVAEPNLKLSGNPPDIIKSYKHVSIMGGNSKMKDTGVRIEKGEVYTVLVTGSIDFCPKGGCQWRRVTPDLGWPFIARVGDPGTSGYFRPLSTYNNSNHITKTHYSPPGNLFVGYKEGPLDTNGNALRPEWYRDDIGAFSVDVIVWQTEDWIRIADFLENRFQADPENVALKEAYEQAAKYRKIELARKETSRALEETQNQIKTIAQEVQLKKAPPPAEHSLPMVTEPAAGAGDASENRVAALEAKLQKLTLMLASLEDMKKQLNEERKKSEQLAAQRDEFEAREKDLLTKLEDGSRVSPVIVIASPKSQTRTEAGKITLSGVVQDDKGIDSLEIFINDKRTTGAFERAVAVTGAAVSKSVDFSETLSLQKGENRIRIRAVDTDGLVAEKKLVVQRLEIRRNVWAVVIGINTYAKVTNLLYAANDARAFYRILVEKNQVPKENVTLLLNEDAGLSKLRSILGTQLKKNAGKEDMVIIYFAGHGATERDTISPDGDGLEKYLLPADADPEDLYATALPMRELSHIFNRLRSERLVFIADACYSGATGGRTISINTGLRARISDNFLDRISSGKGRIILSASGANEVSAEKPEMKHGVFTNFLIRGLDGEADANHDGLITVDEIYNYVSTQVPLATGQEQHPVKKGTVEGQLVLGVVN